MSLLYFETIWNDFEGKTELSNLIFKLSELEFSRSFSAFKLARSFSFLTIPSASSSCCLVISSDPNSSIERASEMLSGETKMFLFSSELSQSSLKNLISKELKFIQKWFLILKQWSIFKIKLQAHVATYIMTILQTVE